MCWDKTVSRQPNPRMFPRGSQPFPGCVPQELLQALGELWPGVGVWVGHRSWYRSKLEHINQSLLMPTAPTGRGSGRALPRVRGRRSPADLSVLPQDSPTTACSRQGTQSCARSLCPPRAQEGMLGGSQVTQGPGRNFWVSRDGRNHPLRHSPSAQGWTQEPPGCFQHSWAGPSRPDTAARACAGCLEHQTQHPGRAAK